MSGRVRPDICATHRAWQAPASGQASHELCVLVSVSAAQAMVQVCDMQAKTELWRQPPEEMQQDQRVRATRDSYNDRLASRQQAVADCIAPDTRQEIFHSKG
jgi:hypothetical protein